MAEWRLGREILLEHRSGGERGRVDDLGLRPLNELFELLVQIRDHVLFIEVERRLHFGKRGTSQHPGVVLELLETLELRKNSLLYPGLHFQDRDVGKNEADRALLDLLLERDKRGRLEVEARRLEHLGVEENRVPCARHGLLSVDLISAMAPIKRARPSPAPTSLPDQHVATRLEALDNSARSPPAAEVFHGSLQVSTRLCRLSHRESMAIVAPPRAAPFRSPCMVRWRDSCPLRTVGGRVDGCSPARAPASRHTPPSRPSSTAGHVSTWSRLRLA